LTSIKIFHLDEHIGETFFFHTLSSKNPLSLTDSRLLKAAEGADVFLDTAVRFMRGDENDASEQRMFAETLFNLLKAGARTVTGAHHSPKSFSKDMYMSLENVLRGSGDIGAMLVTAWGLRQIDAASNQIFVQNVKPRDFQPCDPFIIQGRPSLDETGLFEMPFPPGHAGELADHIAGEKKGGRPPIDEEKKSEAERLRAQGKSYREIQTAIGVSIGQLSGWLGKSGERKVH
jgi:hypothetical protein